MWPWNKSQLFHLLPQRRNSKQFSQRRKSNCLDELRRYPTRHLSKGFSSHVDQCPTYWIELHSISGGFLSFSNILFLFGTRHCRQQSEIGVLLLCALKIQGQKLLNQQPLFLWPNSQIKTEANMDLQHISFLGSIIGYTAHVPEPRGIGSWQGPGSINSTRNSDTLWTVTYMRVPHLLESKAIIVTNQPAFCLCHLADHMV